MTGPTAAPRPSMLAARAALEAARSKLAEARGRSPLVQELVDRLRALGAPQDHRRRTALGFPPFDPKEDDREES